MKMVTERGIHYIGCELTDKMARGGPFTGIWELHILLALIDMSSFPRLVLSELHIC